jgi:hypothetical protein
VWVAAAVVVSPAISDPEHGFAASDGVKPRAAAAAGGLGLTPFDAAQAQSEVGWTHLRGTII